MNNPQNFPGLLFTSTNTARLLLCLTGIGAAEGPQEHGPRRSRAGTGRRAFAAGLCPPQRPPGRPPGTPPPRGGRSGRQTCRSSRPFFRWKKRPRPGGGQEEENVDGLGLQLLHPQQQGHCHQQQGTAPYAPAGEDPRRPVLSQREAASPSQQVPHAAVDQEGPEEGLQKPHRHFLKGQGPPPRPPPARRPDRATPSPGQAGPGTGIPRRTRSTWGRWRPGRWRKPPGAPKSPTGSAAAAAPSPRPRRTGR